MTDTIQTMLAVGAVCTTIVGSSYCQGRRIDDLRADLPARIAGELAQSAFNPSTALGSLNGRVNGLNQSVQNLTGRVANLGESVQDARRDVGRALRPTLDAFVRATPPPQEPDFDLNAWASSTQWVTSGGTISIDDAFSVDVRGWVSSVSPDGQPLPDGDCGIEPGGVLAVRGLDTVGRMAFVEYTIEGETAGSPCDTGTYLFYPLPR